MALTCRNKKASHTEMFHYENSKIDDDKRSETIGKKTFSTTIADVEDEQSNEQKKKDKRERETEKTNFALYMCMLLLLTTRR